MMPSLFSKTAHFIRVEDLVDTAIYIAVNYFVTLRFWLLKEYNMTFHYDDLTLWQSKQSPIKRLDS